MFSSADDTSMAAVTSKNIHENVKTRHEIALEDDFVCDQPCTALNTEKEAETNLFRAETIHSDEIKNNGRQEAALEDDFVLPSEDSSNMSRNVSSNQRTESSQPLFVESSITTSEKKNIGRRKLALEDDFVRNEDATSSKKSNGPNVMEGKIALKEDFSSVEDGSNLEKGNALGRQILNSGHLGGVDDVSSSTVDVDHLSLTNNSRLQLQDRIHEMDSADEDMINDPDYQLNTMSDIR